MLGKSIRPNDINDYDVIYYDAQQDHDHPKNRPFIVLGTFSHKILIAPITHTPPSDKSIYDRYNLEVNQETQKYLTSITKDRDKPKKSYIATGHVCKIPKKEFYKVHQFPRRLGNLTDNVSPKNFKQTIIDIQNQCNKIAGDYIRGKKLYEEHTDKEIKNDPDLTKYAKTQTLSKHAYRKLAISTQDGLRPFFSKQYYPAESQKRHEYRRRQENKKLYRRHPKHRKNDPTFE